MEDFQNFFNKIYTIFDNSNYDINFEKHLRTDESYNNRVVWFNDILDKLVSFGTTLELINRKDKTRLDTRLIDPLTFSNKVSLSSYVLLAVKFSYLSNFVDKYPDKNMWSHHGVLYLLTNICNSQIKLQFCNDTNLDKSVYQKIKLFSNMVYGMVNARNSKLCVGDIFDSYKFRNSSQQFVVNNLVTNGIEEKSIIVIETDKVILSIPLEKLNNKGKIFNEVSNFELIGCSDYKTGLKSLNEICRKCKVDIIH